MMMLVVTMATPGIVMANHCYTATAMATASIAAAAAVSPSPSLCCLLFSTSRTNAITLMVMMLADSPHNFCFYF